MESLISNRPSTTRLFSQLPYPIARLTGLRHTPSMPADSDPKDDEARAERAQARASWPIRRTTLAEQDDAGLVLSGTPAERIAMVWRITLDVWASSGRPMPTYTRAEMPGQFIRGGGDE